MARNDADLNREKLQTLDDSRARGASDRAAVRRGELATLVAKEEFLRWQKAPANSVLARPAATPGVVQHLAGAADTVLAIVDGLLQWTVLRLAMMSESLRALILQEDLAWYVPFPQDGDEEVYINLSAGRRLTKVTTKSKSGTATLTIKIGSTALGGTANSVSSTQDVQTHSTDNEAAAGDAIVLSWSGVSACVGVSITIASEKIPT